MFKNYLKLTSRNLLKYKVFSLINITGLAIGIACSILIILFVTFELSYDKFHQKADRIYRLAVRALIGDTKINQTFSSSITFKTLLQDFPEIQQGVKFLNIRNVIVNLDEKVFNESDVLAVDANFFDVFSFPLVKGSPKTVLSQPNCVVITEEIASKYFGDNNAVGKILKIEFPGIPGTRDFEITGISENVPGNSHFRYNLLISLASFPDFINNPGWTANNFISYFVLKEGSSRKELEAKLPEFTRKYMGGDRFDQWVARGNYWEYFLQPLTEIHLHSDLSGEFEPNGNAAYVYIFLVVAVFILLVACINFMNLTTAKSAVRAKEVGLRKVVGSSRSNLVKQFLGESIIISFIALALAIVIVECLLPAYSNFVGRQLQIHYFDNFIVIPLLMGLALLVGLLSGSYPAFFISAFKPVSVLKGKLKEGAKSSWLRNTLVIFQYSISIILIIGTIVVYKQLIFIQNERLGFDKEHVIVIKNPQALSGNINPFKEKLLQYPGVQNVSISHRVPGQGLNNIGFGAEEVKEGFSLNLCCCDPEFKDVMKLEMAQGRFFSRDHPTDSSAIIINEAALKVFGWDQPINKKINDWSEPRNIFHVIGVVKDFHYESMHQKVRPMGLLFLNGTYKWSPDYISVRVNPGNIGQTIELIENTWDAFSPKLPLEYSFLDEDYDRLYKNEQQTQQLFIIFSFLSIFIACLGLLGLASFMAEQRTKEIGIRKALGATVNHIAIMLSKDFTKWVLLANLVAWPVAYIAMHKWLQDFAYRIEISGWMFVFAGVLAFIIALLTVSFQVVRAARKNPVDSLQYE
jgi:putative ABC transport system permease protein